MGMTQLSPLRKCSVCGIEAYTNEDLNQFTKAQRYKYGRRNICKKCFAASLRKGGKYHKSHQISCKNWVNNNREKFEKNKNRRVTFKENGEFRRIYLNENPRTGICSECGFTGETQIHHDKYD
ncbi:MAG: hypothetical protein ACTSWQ_11360, partial [Candidatus Thorarchaeota archaeon]